MPLIVAVHGIAQQVKGPISLRDAWLPSLRDGLMHAGVELPQDSDLVCPFYGGLFRQPGTKAVGIHPYDASDVTDSWEQELLEAWWREAADVEGDRVTAPESQTKGRTPDFVQRALNALSHSRFFAGMAERALIFNLKQVRSYFRDKSIREAVRQTVVRAVAADTRVMIGHSLGSVVAYECLCAHPEWPVQTLVTLGSPMGIPNLIFDRLQPPPHEGGLGAWPGTVKRWINIADRGDIVALVKDLRPAFGMKVENHLVHNDAEAHDILPYLTAEVTGHAIATGLR
jgi:hypothetical protein